MPTSNPTSFKTTGIRKIAITGVTGLLGRNLLLEIIKNNVHEPEAIQFFLFGRNSQARSLRDRVVQILDREGPAYTGVEDFATLRNTILSNCHFFASDLCAPNLGLSRGDIQQLRRHSMDWFFHTAALTDFRDGEVVRSNLEATNILGTQKVVDLAAKLETAQFVYVSSAYVCGNSSGVIPPNSISFAHGFRNAYERSKLEGEVFVREYFEQRKQLAFKIFRPSTISGRLMENPIGATCKFDVFYSWLAWFMRVKMKLQAKSGNGLGGPLSLNLRVWANAQAGLNIVPVDYAVKAMYQIMNGNAVEDSYHLVNEQELPHRLYLRIMLEKGGINGVEFVDTRPGGLNVHEQFYYKTVGQIFSPYLTGPPMDATSFSTLIDYYLAESFGLESPPPNQSLPTTSHPAGRIFSSR